MDYVSVHLKMNDDQVMKKRFKGYAGKWLKLCAAWLVALSATSAERANDTLPAMTAETIPAEYEAQFNS